MFFLFKIILFNSNKITSLKLNYSIYKKIGLITHLVPIVSSFVFFSSHNFKVTFLVFIIYILISF